MFVPLVHSKLQVTFHFIKVDVFVLTENIVLDAQIIIYLKWVYYCPIAQSLDFFSKDNKITI